MSDAPIFSSFPTTTKSTSMSSAAAAAASPSSSSSSSPSSSSWIFVRLIGLLIVGLIGISLSNNYSSEVQREEQTMRIQVKHFSSTSSPSTTPPLEVPQRPTPPALSIRRTYIPRGRFHVFSDTNETIATRRQEMIKEWGSWTLIDDKQQERPLEEEYYLQYPHRDIPRSEFPSYAWQIDNEYLSKFLLESVQLVQRGQQAILAEYGQNNTTSDMFHIYRYPSATNVNETGSQQGGWTTHASWQGLVKRILHAIMTEDSFVFAMGGHSAAAGHGNHFQQSYTIQIQWILESIFARMGVQFIARNFGNGGLGTVHNGMAAGDIYGHDVDMLMWDSGMTENNNRPQELLHRQGLLASQFKVPVLWTKSERIAREYNIAAGVEIGIPGNGNKGLQKSNTLEQLMQQPLPARYLKCSGDVKSICTKHQYDGVCWIDRSDVTPKREQGKAPGGRASWHPGKWEHQLFGRVLAFTILEATKDALTIWYNADQHILDDNVWHVTAHYESLRKRVEDMHLEEYHCTNYVENNMAFMCKYPLKARTEFTPRAYPSWTSIRTLMPPEMLANINEALPNIYDPPDIFNPSLHPPEGAIDVLSIVEAGVPFRSILAPTYAQNVYKKPIFSKPPLVPVGKGVVLETKSGDQYCDGSLDSFCSRGEDNSCLLSAHNDGRNGLKFDGLSGWVVMNIPDLLKGYIVIKLETWHPSWSIKKTEGWINVNNETITSHRDLQMQHSILSSRPASQTNINETSNSVLLQRRLKKKPPELCDMFLFEYSINGEITPLDKWSFLERKQNLARVVETIVLLDDPDYTGGVETEVEVAIRIVGCGRLNVFKMSHIYWA